MVLPIPRRRRPSSLPARARRSNRVAAGAAQQLLRLSRDDPALDRLAAAAVLVVQIRSAQGQEQRQLLEASACSAWSTEEMRCQFAEVERLEGAWRSTFDGVTGPNEGADEATLRAAGLFIAFSEMEAAVQKGAPLPRWDELIVCAGRSLLGGNFASPQEVEAAVRSALVVNAGVGRTLPMLH